MTLENSTWRCRCGTEQPGAPTTYAIALQDLRRHQAEKLCAKQHSGAEDRIHSKRPEPVSDLNKFVDREPTSPLYGPPRPPTARTRDRREGLPWLPGNQLA